MRDWWRGFAMGARVERVAWKERSRSLGLEKHPVIQQHGVQATEKWLRINNLTSSLSSIRTLILRSEIYQSGGTWPAFH